MSTAYICGGVFGDQRLEQLIRAAFPTNCPRPINAREKQRLSCIRPGALERYPIGDYLEKIAQYRQYGSARGWNPETLCTASCARAASECAMDPWFKPAEQGY